MPKQGLIHAAVTAAAIATFLATESEAATYDGRSDHNNQQPLSLTGEVQQVQDEAFHTLIQFRVDNTVWTAVLEPSVQMQRASLLQDQLVGQTVTIVGYLYPDEATTIQAERIIVADRAMEFG